MLGGYFPAAVERHCLRRFPEGARAAGERGELGSKGVAESVVALEDAVRSARLRLTAPVRPYEHVRRPSEEVVHDGEPDGVEEEVEDAAWPARGVADGDGGGAEQHGPAVVVDVVEQRVEEKVQSAAAVARGAVHLLLDVSVRVSGYAGDHRIEEGGHEVLSVVGFDGIHHVEGEVALENEVQTSVHKK